jgi:hypothetical protein
MIFAMIIALVGSPDINRVVQSIEAVENTPWTAPGGGLQFKRETWSEETDLPYERARSRELARNIAAVRISKYVHKLNALGITPTPYLLGSIWNKGWTGALRMRREKMPDDYAERVNNYFHAYTK